MEIRGRFWYKCRVEGKLSIEFCSEKGWRILMLSPSLCIFALFFSIFSLISYPPSFHFCSFFPSSFSFYFLFLSFYLSLLLFLLFLACSPLSLSSSSSPCSSSSSLSPIRMTRPCNSSSFLTLIYLLIHFFSAYLIRSTRFW